MVSTLHGHGTWTLCGKKRDMVLNMQHGERTQGGNVAGVVVDTKLLFCVRCLTRLSAL